MNGRALLAAKMPEAALQASVLELLHAYGWLAFHAATAATSVRGRIVHRTAQLGDRGFPDVVAVHPTAGRALAVELKSQAGRLGPGQEEWLAAFGAAGVESYCWRPEHWLSGEVQRVLTPAWRPEEAA